MATTYLFEKYAKMFNWARVCDPLVQKRHYYDTKATRTFTKFSVLKSEIKTLTRVYLLIWDYTTMKHLRLNRRSSGCCIRLQDEPKCFSGGTFVSGLTWVEQGGTISMHTYIIDSVKTLGISHEWRQDMEMYHRENE